MAKKRKKPIAEQTKRGPGRPRITADNPAGKPKVRRKNKWSRMHVRSVLYKHYKNRYPNWQSTKEDAALAIEQLKAAGYKSATQQGIINVVKSQRLAEIQKKKEAERPSENVDHYFQNHPQMLRPVHFFDVENEICYPWREISNKIVVFSKYVWTTGAIFRGGAGIPYGETFAEQTRGMSRLQEEAKREGESKDYQTDWFFKIVTKNARWDKELGAYLVEAIACDGDGEKTFYFGEEEAEIPMEEKPGEPEEKPAPEKPGEEIPEPSEKPPTKEITPEQRVEVEKEKVRAEAQATADVKMKKIDTLKELLKEGIITKQDFFDELNKI